MSQGPDQIPQTDQLKEASQEESWAQVMNADPETFTERQMDIVIAELRAQRERQQKAEAQGLTTKPKKGADLATSSPRSAGELDL